MVLALLLIPLLSSSVQAELQAYDCSAPTSSKFLAHKKCADEDPHHVSKPLILAQFNDKINVSAHLCRAVEHVHVGYCGHYSATKVTDQSSYNVPKILTSEECVHMVSTLSVDVPGEPAQSVPLKMNTVNIVKFFTHGAVTYSGTNVACTGQSLRLLDGRINDNMIRWVQWSITLQEIEVKIDGSQVFMPNGHALGQVVDAGGRDNLDTVVWTPPPALRCNIGAIATLPFTSSDSRVYTNVDQMIQLTFKQSHYHQGCKVSYMETTSPGIVLLKPGKTGLVMAANTQSTKLGAHYQTQLDFLGSRLAKRIRSSYQLRYDPECNLMDSSQLHATVALPSHRCDSLLGLGQAFI